MKFINKSDRPWGAYYVIHDENNYKLKKIYVKPGERLSYQYHKIPRFEASPDAIVQTICNI